MPSCDALQFTVWETHDGEEWSEERDRQNAQRKFVLLDTNSDNELTPEASLKEED